MSAARLGQAPRVEVATRAKFRIKLLKNIVAELRACSQGMWALRRHEP